MRVAPPRRVVERALADEVGVGVEQRVNGLQPEVRHPDVIGVRVDDRDRDAAAPVLDDVAALAAESVTRNLSDVRHIELV
jgi:hypothetical protein